MVYMACRKIFSPQNEWPWGYQLKLKGDSRFKDIHLHSILFNCWACWHKLQWPSKIIVGGKLDKFIQISLLVITKLDGCILTQKAAYFKYQLLDNKKTIPHLFLFGDLICHSEIGWGTKGILLQGSKACRKYLSGFQKFIIIQYLFMKHGAASHLWNKLYGCSHCVKLIETKLTLNIPRGKSWI